MLDIETELPYFFIFDMVVQNKKSGGRMPACRYLQHEVLTWTEWILASTGDAGPTFNIYWVGIGL